MITSFGVKQAEEASKFAVTAEQKKTVLATMAMLGIKNKIAQTVKKAKFKWLAKVAASDMRLRKLNKKYDKTNGVLTGQIEKLDIIRDTATAWTL